MKQGLAVFVLLFCSVTARASDLEKQAKIRDVEGSFQVQSIVHREDAYVVKFQKAPADATAQVLVLELQELSPGLLKEGEQLQLSAKVRDLDDKTVEALQVFLILPRGASRTKVWLLSRKSKDLNLDGISFLRMHSESDDYRVY